MMDILLALAKIMRNIKKWYISDNSNVNFKIGTHKLHFSSITPHMRAASKLQYMSVVGAKPFPANQDVK